MKQHLKGRERKPERGVALFIALFTLLLISVVATALILMAGTESAIDANYKSAMQAFYHAKAGTEEARGRLWSGNPNALGSFVVPLGSTLAVDQVRYILNPSAGETVSPTNLTASNPYADFEYQQEWGTPVTSRTVTTTTSASAVAGLTGPLYKWVRITAQTERSGNIDVNGDSVLDNANPLFYDGAQQLLSNQIPANTQAWQVYTITALAVTPLGSRRLVQYTVAPVYFNLKFFSALTFDGANAAYGATNSNVWLLNGNDRSGSNPTTCPIPPQATKPAIGVVTNPDIVTVTASIPANRLDHYVGAPPVGTPPGTTPSIGNVSALLPTSQQTVTGLEALVVYLTSIASQIVTGPATSLPNYGSGSSPLITVVQGDLSLPTVTGYGILVVTGNLTVQGNTGWRGIVLVIGQGVLTVSGGGNGEFDGAVLVAKTRNSGGGLLDTLGTPTVNWSGGGGNGIYYDSCWINNATSAATYKVLSFREIPSP